MKFIDLSHTIHSELSVFPGDLPVKLKQIKEIHNDGYNNYQLCSGMHVGTHIDGPMHLTHDHRFISELPLDKFTGKGTVIDVVGKEKIRLKNTSVSKLEPGQIVLFYSGFDKYFGEDTYYNNHPVFERDIIDFLVEQKVKMIGIDWPSPDREPYTLHEILLSNDILILENLKNLDLLITESEFEVFTFPLKIKADSSLVRAVAGVR